ncbi:MAG: amidohydrolase [Oscillospiraceae bacterium]|nr:amidohydrolase [Oscillospiraceae bacterium]
MVKKHYELLHRIPERAFQEYRTAEYIEQELKAAGYAPVRIRGTGLYADLCVDPQLPWLLFRADMDALPVQEETGLPFASETEGMMHACGHDAHMAMLLTAAILLKDSKLPQNIRFLFQPAEEITSGATAMIEGNAIPENTVAAFGFHVWPKVPKGKIVAKAGPLMASSTRIQINCAGKNAHCSKREEGADALLTAAKIATRLQEAEAMADGDGTVLFVGKLHSGAAHNIVSAEAEMVGTLRSYSEQSRERVLTKLEQIVQEAAEEYGTQAKLSAFSYNPAIINPLELAEKVQKLLPEAISEFAPSLAAEDFARYQHKVPGIFLWLGVGDTAALHNGKFLVPEEVLPVGVESWLKLANHKW